MSDLVDLHRHLDGSLRASTMMELAEARGIVVPEKLGFSPGMGLSAALTCFEFTLSLLQTSAAVRRVASEICQDAAADGVTTLEIRFAPQLHPGAGSVEAVVDAALEGIDGRAGLLLCGLYGESPDVLQGHVSCAASRPGVVGIDLAGGPTPGDAFRLEDYAGPFGRARDLGIGRTVHAGEGRHPAEIRAAIEVLHAQRVGHGTTLLDDPSVVDLVLEGRVTIEACPTSNWHVGVISTIESHPLPRWLELGVAVCVNTDNTLLSAVTASEELERVARMPGMTAAGLDRLRAFGHAAAFRRS